MINKCNKEVSKIEKKINGSLSIFQKIYDNFMKQIDELRKVIQKHDAEIANHKKDILESENYIVQHEDAKLTLAEKIKSYEEKANKFAENFIV